MVKDGACGACLWEEEKKYINWNDRLVQLKEVVKRAKIRAKVRDTYDCAIGVSGGKDSTFQALYAKKDLGLNCLLVSAAPDEITEVGQHNFDNLLSKGFDCIRIFTDITLVKQLMKRDFFKYCHFRKANEYPLWASTFRMAKMHNIPLIIQGENAALTLGVSEDMNMDWDASTICKTNTIAGATAREHYIEVPENALYTYQFPDMSDWDGQAIWLNYFIENWSSFNNAMYASCAGALSRTDDDRMSTGRLYSHTCVDSDFHIVSQMHKYYKFGFGFATDEACEDVRQGRMSREDGFKVIEKFDGLCHPIYVKRFCDFIGITEDEHWKTVEQFKKYDPWSRWETQSNARYS